MPGPFILSESQQIGLLQRRLNIAEEGWRYTGNMGFDSLWFLYVI